MIEFIDNACKPLVFVLASWSLRWGVLIALLGIGLVFWPPRRAATQLLLCQLVLVGGLLLPFLPRYWGPVMSPEPVTSLTTPLPAAAQSSSAITLPSTAPVSISPAGAPQISRPASVPLQKPSGKPDEPAHAQAAAVAASEPAAPTLGTERILLLAITLFWLMGVVLLGSRLVFVWCRLRHLRLSAKPASTAALQLFHKCRSELRVCRSAELLTHPAARAPVLLGAFRPAILLPPSWDELPLDHRRAALLHELSHLVRRDDWAKVFQEIVGVFFFFHPLVRWLLGRLEGERERECDAAVVRVGMPPRNLPESSWTSRNLWVPVNPRLHWGKPCHS